MMGMPIGPNFFEAQVVIPPEARETPSESADPAPQRIFYAVGPGDAAGYFRNRRDGVAPAFHTPIAFSLQFFKAFEKQGHRLYLLSSHARAERVTLGPHTIENLPRPRIYFCGGIRHHLGLLVYGLRILSRALRFRAQVAIVDSGTTHWIVLALFALFRIPVIAVLHNALWAAGYRPTHGVRHLIHITDGWFFRRFAAASVAVSPEIRRQILAVAGQPKGPQFVFVPLYRKDFFLRIPPPPPHSRRPFNVLYLGRVEYYKGIFDLMTMAETLDREAPGDYRWKIVGEGSDFAALEAEVLRRNLGHLVRVQHNMADEDAAVATLGWAHVNIVPTRHEFREGLAMTAVEGVLAGRPVVLTSVVPAGEVLPGATVEVPADDVEGLTGAIRQLANDEELYQRLRAGTTALQPTFYDPTRGLGACLLQAMKAIGRA
jgi:glycosyltransferase involved in cell wall biosynthesis